jgi:methylglyoxal synthase
MKWWDTEIGGAIEPWRNRNITIEVADERLNIVVFVNGDQVSSLVTPDIKALFRLSGPSNPSKPELPFRP